MLSRFLVGKIQHIVNDVKKINFSEWDSIDGGYSIKESSTIVFHEMGHYFQYEYGTKKGKNFHDYLNMELQAEMFNVILNKQLERRFDMQLIPKDYVPAYTTKKDVDFLKSYYGIKE